MQDIADRLGISVVAVSKALSGKSGVSEALRDEVRRTAGELGYSYTVRRKQPGISQEMSAFSHHHALSMRIHFISNIISTSPPSSRAVDGAHSFIP